MPAAPDPPGQPGADESVDADRQAADPVARVLSEMRRSRPARLIRRFRHGSGGTSLIALDGQEVVLKAWPARSPIAMNLPMAFQWMQAMRAKGVTVPSVVEQDELDGQCYVTYERLPGRWPARVTKGLLGEMIGVVDLQRGAAPGGGHDWPQTLRAMLFEGDPLFSMPPAVLEAHPTGRVLLGLARARLQDCDPALMTGGDIVHGDFAPENVLASRGHLSGVIDWEQCRAGDARLDLVGLLLDMELGAKARPAVSAQFRHTLHQRIPASLLALYIAIYAVRYAGWALGTEDEQGVLDLIDRLRGEPFDK